MPEYETKGKIIRGTFIKSEDKAVKLLEMMGIMIGVETAAFKYGHPFPDVGKGNLKINVPNYSFSVEYFGDNPFEIERMFNPEHFEAIEIKIEPSRILDKKEKLMLTERGYKFRGFEYHQPPFERGIHIISDKVKKETIAGVSEKAGNYEMLNKFKAAMTELGFMDLKEETKKVEIVKLF